jgi:hypothetical protein
VYWVLARDEDGENSEARVKTGIWSAERASMRLVAGGDSRPRDVVVLSEFTDSQVGT